MYRYGGPFKSSWASTIALPSWRHDCCYTPPRMGKTDAITQRRLPGRDCPEQGLALARRLPVPRGLARTQEHRQKSRLGSALPPRQCLRDAHITPKSPLDNSLHAKVISGGHRCEHSLLQLRGGSDKEGPKYESRASRDPGGHWRSPLCTVASCRVLI